MSKPIVRDDVNKLILGSNSIYQLNIVNNTINNKGLNSLIPVINKTCTAMGHRLLKEKILNPITNIENLNEYYDFIDEMIPLYKDYQDILNNILDLDR